MKELRGIFPILNTPFDENMEVDEEDLRRHTNYAIEEGAHGLGVNGWNSECYKLSCEERMWITERVLEEVNGRVPVVVGVSAAGTVDSVTLARHASEKGADAVFSTPLIGGEATPESIYAHFKAINDNVNTPIMVQEHLIPVPSVVIARMAEELERVCYVKEERPMNAGQKITEILTLTNHKVPVFSTGVNMMDELQRGAIGQMPSCVGLARYVKIFESYMQGDLETAWTEYERLMPLITFRKQVNGIQLAKELLRGKGVFKSSRVRSPVGTPLDDMEIKMLNQLTERLGPPI